MVDAGQPGAATAAGAGIVCPWVDHEEDEAWYLLAREGARHYGELPLDESAHATVGALLVAGDWSELEPSRALLAGRRAEAPEMGEVTEVGRAADLFPPLDPGLKALFVPGAARVDGRAVRDSLLAAAVRQGTTIVRGSASLTPDGTVVIASPPTDLASPFTNLPPSTELASPFTDPAAYGPVAQPVADAVIVAAGAWAGELCRPLGVELPVFPRRGQIVHATMAGSDTAAWPIVLPTQGPYLLGFPDGRLVMGATVEEAGFDPRITVAGMAEVLSGALGVAPGLADATVTETRAGLRPVMATGRPLIARVADRVVAVTGMSAYGLTAGPYAGLVAATLAMGDEPPLDLAQYGL
ncbi:FAD-dependent oxidoreductase [Nonomuraea sp. NPDC049152]|uniref:NAD(P)/FAD-dependent oxidoreductase n=1 Tax=Nonomuraea sp. NPDC049152 TaxID=3154350 RepID=UPI0033DBA858